LGIGTSGSSFEEAVGEAEVFALEEADGEPPPAVLGEPPQAASTSATKKATERRKRDFMVRSV
jgi:hypothetical protein